MQKMHGHDNIVLQFVYYDWRHNISTLQLLFTASTTFYHQNAHQNAMGTPFSFTASSSFSFTHNRYIKIFRWQTLLNACIQTTFGKRSNSRMKAIFANVVPPVRTTSIETLFSHFPPHHSFWWIYNLLDRQNYVSKEVPKCIYVDGWLCSIVWLLKCHTTI